MKNTYKGESRMKIIYAGGHSIPTVSLPLTKMFLKECVVGDDRPKLVLYQTDLEPDTRAMDGFRCVNKYEPGSESFQSETGRCGQFRFLPCSDIHILPDAGAHWTPLLYSTGRTRADVYETFVIDEARLFKIFNRSAIDLLFDEPGIFKAIKGGIADAVILSGVTNIV